MATTSPEVSIEPFDFIAGQWLPQVLAYLILVQPSHGQSDGLTCGDSELRGEPLQFFVGGPIEVRCSVWAFAQG